MVLTFVRYHLFRRRSKSCCRLFSLLLGDGSGDCSGDNDGGGANGSSCIHFCPVVVVVCCILVLAVLVSSRVDFGCIVVDRRWGAPVKKQKFCRTLI